jgi:phospholipid transport system transporter-binding protein
MPAPTDATAGVSRAGEALRFAGVLSRAQVPALWKQLPGLEGVTLLDLGAVSSMDSAGLALLAEVASTLGGGVTLSGNPSGLAELRTAYRLDDQLGFAAG